MMQTKVNVSALRPYTGSIPPKYAAAAMDDGYSVLTPERYIKMRLADQLSFYQGKTVKLETQLKRWQWTILIAGGVGTLLAAVGLELWVALTTALVAAFTTYLQYRQVEGTLIQYNQAATNLVNVQTWWLALSGEEQAKQENVELLVDHTEKILESELTGWVQQMQDALAALRDQQSKQLVERTEQQEKELAELRERQEEGSGRVEQTQEPSWKPLEKRRLPTNRPRCRLRRLEMSRAVGRDEHNSFSGSMVFHSRGCQRHRVRPHGRRGAGRCADRRRRGALDRRAFGGIRRADPDSARR